MPEMTVWPVSSSVRTRKVGSSSESEKSALPSLSWSALVFGSTATWMTGSGKIERLEHDRLVRVTERVTGGRALQTDDGDDVAGVDDVVVLAVVGVHLQDAADPLALVLRRVEERRALLEGAGVDADVGQLADEGVGLDLEGERRERLVVVRLADRARSSPRSRVAGRRRDVERARQVVDDGVEQRLDALVLERRAAEHRHDVVGDRAVAKRASEGRPAVISSSPTYFSRMSSSKCESTSIELVVRLFGGLRAGRPGSRSTSQLVAVVLVVPDRAPSSRRGRRRRRSPTRRRSAAARRPARRRGGP